MRRSVLSETQRQVIREAVEANAYPDLKALAEAIDAPLQNVKFYAADHRKRLGLKRPYNKTKKHRMAPIIPVTDGVVIAAEQAKQKRQTPHKLDVFLPWRLGAYIPLKELHELVTWLVEIAPDYRAERSNEDIMRQFLQTS